MLCWLNGTLLQDDQAHVSVQDRGFLYGDTLFETLRIHQGKPVLLDEHLNRLVNGIHSLGFTLPTSLPELRAAACLLPKEQGLSEGVLRITLSRGIGARGAAPKHVHTPTLLLTLSTLSADLEAKAQRGLSLITSRWRKPGPDMLPNEMKLGAYLNSVLAAQEAAAAGADEALLLDARGDVAECSHSNLFLVRQNTLITPWLNSGALAGVTRAKIIALAHALGIEVSEQPVPIAALDTADELFVTNAVIGVMPVAQLNQHMVTSPGPITRQLQAAYRLAIAR